MKEDILYHLIPQFIYSQYEVGKTEGQFKAVTLFMDISGFTRMTQSFMQHGKAGAEELAYLVNTIFEPIILTIHEQGGFVTGFAGDALTIVFPADDEATALAACQTALAIRQIIGRQARYQTSFGEFDLAVKQGMSAGLVEWGIVGPIGHKTHYFRGTAVADCIRAEQQAGVGEIILAEAVQTIVPSAQVELKKGNGRDAQLMSLLDYTPINRKRPLSTALTSKICYQFFPAELWHYAKQGEFRQVGLVFLAFQADLNPTQLDDVITRAIQTCDQFGGHFIEVDFGDKGGLILACFGAPKSYENDLERALGFTLALSEIYDELNITWRAGVTYGRVYAGMVGTQLRGKYAMVGNVVNFAARLMVKANWRQIFVSSLVAQHVKFKFAYAGSFMFKGFAKPLPAYELLAYDNAQPEQLGLPKVHVVGRDVERQRLLEFANGVFAEKSAGTAVIYGEPGIGKSSLVADLRNHIEQPFLWLECPTDQILRQAFNPFIAGLKSRFGQVAKASDVENKAAFSNRWRQLTKQLQAEAAPTTLYQELIRIESIIGALIDLRWDDSLYERLDGELRYENTLTAVTTWLVAESFLQPVILLLEDGQWLDSASQALLTNLNKEMDDAPLLIIITSRYQDDGRLPEYSYPAHNPPVTIQLDALNTTAVYQQAEHILNGKLQETFFTRLIEKTQGNPFFVQQLLYYFQENSLLIRNEAGKWDVVDDQISLPNSINAILIARIDRLSQRVKEVVQTAAVLGIEFEVDILSRMLQTNISHEIEQAEIYQIWTAFGRLRYIFKHLMLREAAYDMQLRQQLRNLHRVAASAYEQLHHTDLTPHYATLAYHYKYAQDLVQERKYARLAGEAASQKGNQQEAIAYFSQALALTPDDEKYELLLLREEAYHLLGDRDKQAIDIIALTRLILLAPKTPSFPNTRPLLATTPEQLTTQVDVILRQVRFRSAISDYSAAIVATQRALFLAQDAGNLMQEIQSRYWWGESLERQGRFDEAQEQIELGLQLLQNIEQPDTKARFLKESGWIAFRRGESALAREKLEEALNLVRLTGNRREEIMVLKALGGAANAGGDYLTARTWQLLGLEIAQEIGHRQEEGSLLNNLGNTNRYLGELETAVAYHQRGSDLVNKTGWRIGEAISQTNLGLILPYLGEYERAAIHAQNGLRLSQQVHARMIQAVSWYALGNIAIETQDWENGELAYENAIRLYEEMALPHYVVESKSGLVCAYLAQQKSTEIPQLLSEILAYLDAGGRVSSVEEPVRVYLTCYQALEALGDSKADDLLQQAYDLINQQLARLPDQQTRRGYVDNIPFHRAVMVAWQKRQSHT